jgi:hypothetical protein
MQRAAVAALGDVLFGLFGLRAREIGGDGDES